MSLMKWYLGRREIIVFAAIIIFVESIYLLGDSGIAWLVFGLVAPLAILLAINIIVGVSQRRR